MLNLFFEPANIIPSVFFLVIILYWVIVLLGVIDLDFIDFDVDVDVDTDVEVDSSNIFGLNKVMAFFNLGKIPFMVFLTFLVIPWWFSTILVNHFLGIHWFLPGLLVVVATFVVSLIVSKVLTQPFVKLFEVLDKEEKEMDIVGTVGEVRLKASDLLTGQGEFKLDKAFVSVKIRTRKGVVVNPGDKVLVVDDRQKDEFYIVEPYFEI